MARVSRQMDLNQFKVNGVYDFLAHNGRFKRNLLESAQNREFSSIFCPIINIMLSTLTNSTALFVI